MFLVYIMLNIIMEKIRISDSKICAYIVSATLQFSLLVAFLFLVCLYYDIFYFLVYICLFDVISLENIHIVIIF